MVYISEFRTTLSFYFKGVLDTFLLGIQTARKKIHKYIPSVKTKIWNSKMFIWNSAGAREVKKSLKEEILARN